MASVWAPVESSQRGSAALSPAATSLSRSVSSGYDYGSFRRELGSPELRRSPCLRRGSMRNSLLAEIAGALTRSVSSLISTSGVSVKAAIPPLADAHGSPSGYPAQRLGRTSTAPPPALKAMYNTTLLRTASTPPLSPRLAPFPEETEDDVNDEEADLGSSADHQMLTSSSSPNLEAPSASGGLKTLSRALSLDRPDSVARGTPETQAALRDTAGALANESSALEALQEQTWHPAGILMMEA